MVFIKDLCYALVTSIKHVKAWWKWTKKHKLMKTFFFKASGKIVGCLSVTHQPTTGKPMSKRPADRQLCPQWASSGHRSLAIRDVWWIFKGNGFTIDLWTLHHLIQNNRAAYLIGWAFLRFKHQWHPNFPTTVLSISTLKMARATDQSHGG